MATNLVGKEQIERLHLLQWERYSWSTYICRRGDHLVWPSEWRGSKGGNGPQEYQAVRRCFWSGKGSQGRRRCTGEQLLHKRSGRKVECGDRDRPHYPARAFCSCLLVFSCTFSNTFPFFYFLSTPVI